MITTSFKKQTSTAVAQLHAILGKEIEDLINSVNGTHSLAGNEAAKAVQLASECSALRERLGQFLGNKTPDLIPAESSTPKPITRVDPEPTPKRIKLALSRSEAAEMLGISTITLDRIVSRGLLHPSLATRRPLFAPSELERFMRDTSKTISPNSTF